MFGAASWGGLSFNDPGSSGNTNVALLRRTDLAASIRDNLTGDIDVGRVFTLQVHGVLNTSTGGVTGGNIDGRVQAWEEDVFSGTEEFDDPPAAAAIEFVRAGNRITQPIVASDGQDTPASPGVFSPPPNYVGPSMNWTPVEEQLLGQLAHPTKGSWLRRGASIRRVVIGPSPKAQGIVGPTGVTPVDTNGGLWAESGRIFSVRTTGPLGVVTPVSGSGDIANTATLRAGFGIFSVRMIDDSGTSIVDANNTAHGNNWSVDAVANKYFQPGYFDATKSFYADRTPATGGITVMHTRGAIVGAIHAAVLTNASPEPGNADLHGHSGIIAGGSVSGVTIDYHVRYANILGTSVNAVHIGKTLQGAVVAYGTGGGGSGLSVGSGDIFDLQVGTAPPTTPESDPFPHVPSGFLGCDVAPLDMSPGLSGDPTSAVTAEGYDADRWLYRSGGDTGCEVGGSVGAAVDSVIRAEARIVKSAVSFMTQRIGACASGGEERIAAYRPRIEAPYCTFFSLGVMEAGVVWSGKLNYNTGTGALADGREDDYLTSNASDFHTIGPAADFWWKSIPNTLLFDQNLRIAGDPTDTTFGYGHGGVLGELHLPTLPSGAYVLVDGGIGDTNDADAIGLHYDAIASTEDSPRGRRLLSATPGDVEPSYVPKGIITVDSSKGMTFSGQDGGLNGQVVLRAVPAWLSWRALRDDYWKGQVRVGDAFAGSPAVVVLDPAANTPGVDHQQYEYAALATDLGQDTSGNDNGGAVGVAPFELHASDCIPPTKGSFNTPPAVALVQPVLSVSNVWDGPVRTRFYGPVIDQSSDSAAVSIEASASGTFTTDRVSATSLFTITVAGGSALAGQQERDVLISGTCGSTYDPSTIYRVVRAQDSIDAESPGQLAGVWEGYSSPEDVQRFAHYFRIACSLADLGSAGGVPGPDGVLDNNDFIVFINYFFAGGCDGDIVGPCGFRGRAGSQEVGSGAADRAGMIRSALQALIESETDADRRSQLQEMLNALPEP
ncbi:MAG: hypothetical protein K2Q09_10905 [Phycisphaerales bacterium]|nr:hypothetical protein [Phycisphaerales bacterium]